jgi:hypothetical protein
LYRYIAFLLLVVYTELDLPKFFAEEMAKQKRIAEEPLAVLSATDVYQLEASADEDIFARSQAKEKRKKRTAEEPIPRMKLTLTKKAELEKAVSELCTEQYKLGFKNAQAQAALLCPVGTDLSAMNLLKRVKNGEIVSDDDDEEE